MVELFEQIRYEAEKNNDVVLVTLIESGGSAPRKTGAQMLVGKEGRILGTIGGGAVELRAVEMAKDLLAEKRSVQHAFQLKPNAGEDIGMICGGNVTAFFQFIGNDDRSWLELCRKIQELFKIRKSGWFVQDLHGGTPSLLDTGMNPIFGELKETIHPDGNHPFISADKFLMPLPVSERVIIFGGGHIAAALVPLLKTIGFRSWILDDRSEFITEERFPLAEKRILCDFTHIDDFVRIDGEDYIVIMTNGHVHDFESELHVLRGPFAYIGVIGSHRKTASVNQRLRENGIPEEVICKVHTPIGTAIKAVTPEEIAVSIAGELILVRAQRREGSTEERHHCPMK